MTLKIVRRVRGNLHGSIDISELEDLVIAHPVFQRLRRIKQTAFLSLVFPGASHTRFEHSLGVMHLAGTAWQKIHVNQLRLNQSCLRFPFFSMMEKPDNNEPVHGLLMPTFSQLPAIFSSDYILQTLRLAALLHDIGHPAFSHSGEKFLCPMDTLIGEGFTLPEYLENYLKKQSREGHGRKTVSHEVYTILLADRLLNDIYKNNPEITLRIAPQDVVSVIKPEIPPRPESPLRHLKVQGLCNELISGEIDLDRMDYLQRDSRECGVVYGMFDVDRIMDSLSLYFDPKTESMHLAIQFSGLAAFEDYLRARQSMYVQLYFHKTSVACEAMLQNIKTAIPSWHFPASPEEYILTDEYNARELMKEAIENSGLSPSEKHRVTGVTTDLYLHRKLWKRVYEVASYDSGDTDRQKESLEQVRALLKKTEIPCELVSSSNYLTRFRPRKKRGNSHNYLRLIKKDEKQFPRVEPVEDYSSLIREGMVVHLHRIYTSPEKASVARKIIMDSFFSTDKNT